VEPLEDRHRFDGDEQSWLRQLLQIVACCLRVDYLKGTEGAVVLTVIVELDEAALGTENFSQLQNCEMSPARNKDFS
jgi:hypothetical protein